jgi:Beta-galactosidase
MGILGFSKEKLMLDGKEFYLAFGDMQYFRVLPGGWKRRLELMKDFGLTALQTYVPWNMHEPKKGEFNFDGMLNLEAFLLLAEEVGLKVMLRPSPYICAEWDFGGLPSWLLKNPNIELRCSDPEYLSHVKTYYERLCKEFVPHLSTNGGPIIAVAIENEYGSYGNDKAYLNFIKDELIENGVDVPFYTTDGYAKNALKNGTLPGIWKGVNYRIESEDAIGALREFQTDKPAMIGEYWSGRGMHWGEIFNYREVEPIAKGYKEALCLGGYLSFYMFCGGTNFGFMNGANFGVSFTPGNEDVAKYISGLTSYDVDALVSENGVPTKKYYACRRELDKYLKKIVREDNPPEYKTQIIENVKLTKSASLFGNIENISTNIVISPTVKTMEDLGQDYGFILYSTFVEGPNVGEQALFIDGLHDRATIYVDGKYTGTYMRDRKCEPIKITVPDNGIRLDILVENLGRINYGTSLKDRKGILGGVRLDYGYLYRWTIYTLPMIDLSKLYYDGKITNGTPAFYSGTFSAEKGTDSFLYMKDWKKGCVWINGFNLGRYWEIGPQETLYVPGEILKEYNTIEIFEIHHSNDSKTISFIGEHILESKN